MKKIYTTVLSYFPVQSSLIKAVALGTAMATLLSSVSPVFSSNLSITGAIIRSDNSPNVAYPFGSHGSIVFSGDDDFCGVDRIVGRDGTLLTGGVGLSAETQYNRFITNQVYYNRNPYGSMTQQIPWTGNGLAGPTSGYMGALTGGAGNILPRAFGVYSFATGCGSYASGNYSTAFGAGATAKGGGAIAFGVSALAKDQASIAIGIGSEASAISALAFGGLATAKAENSLAVGIKSLVEEGAKSAVAIGTEAQATLEEAVALGAYSVSNRKRGVLGYNPLTGKAKTAGDHVWESSLAALSVGNVESGKTRQITGVSAGSEDTDAVNVAQLKAVREAAAIKGLKINTTNTDFTDPVAAAQDSIALGNNAHVDKDSSYGIAIGKNATIEDALYSLAVGMNAKIDEGSLYAFAIGTNAKIDAKSSYGIAIGTNAEIGKGSRHGIAIGTNAKALIEDSVALGLESISDVGAGIAGYDPSTRRNSIAEDKIWRSTLAALSIGSIKDGKTRQIVGVAAGTEDTDAVNVAQLKALQSSITPSWDLSVNGKNTTNVNSSNPVDLEAGSTNITLTKGENDNKVKFDLARGITVGTVQAEKIQVGKNTLDETGLVINGGPKITTSGIDAGGRKITGVAEGSDNTDAVNKGQLDESLKRLSNNLQSDDSAVVHYDKKEGEKGGINYASVTLGGKDKDKVQVGIHNVADGAISSESHDAISGSQLYSLGSKVASYFGGGAEYKNGQLSEPDFKLNIVNADGVSEATYHDVTSAFKGVGNSLKNIKNEIKNEIATVQGDSLLWSDKEQAFVATHHKADGKEGQKTSSTIRFVAGGAQTQNSTEAINGSQMYMLGTRMATFFGGGADFGNGNWDYPKFKFKTIKDDGTEEENSYDNVADAFAGVGTTFTTIQKKFTEQVNNVIQKFEGESVVKWDNATKSITIGQEKDGNVINLQNKDNESRTIAGLIGGEISKDSNEAVNGSQLHQLGSEVATSLDSEAKYDGGKWVAPKFKLKQFNSINDVSDASYDDVVSAFAGVGTSFTNVKNEITNVKNELTKKVEKEITAVQGNALLWDEEKSAFAAMHGKEDSKKNNSKITSLQNGVVSKDSTDAVNGSQIYSLNKNIVHYFDKNAAYNEDGSWKEPTFKLKAFKDDGNSEEETYHDVASAFEGVGNSFTNVKNEITKEIKKINTQITNVTENNLVQHDSETGKITIGLKENGNLIDVSNKKGETRTLSGVKDGTLSETSKEAVTGSQLHTLGSKVASYFGGSAKYENGKLSEPDFKLNIVNADGSSKEATYHDVATAFAGVGTSFANVNTNITKKFNELTQNIANIKQEVQGDALLWDKDVGAFVATHGEKGSKKTNSKITSLKDGVVSSLSTDAVNGSQLYSLNKQFATYFGGGAGYNTKGEWTAPTFKVKGIKENGQTEDKDYTNVAAAFEGVGNSFTNVAKKINKEISDAKSDSLNWNETANAFVATHGEEKSSSKITSLQNGAINENSTDAVAGQQLHTLGTEVAKYFGGGATFSEGSLKEPTYQLSQVSQDGTVKTTDFKNVGSAFEGLDKNIKNVNNRIKEVSQGVAQDSLNWNKKAGAFVATHGEKDGTKTNSKITSLQNGAINEGSTDAVAGQQLHKLGNEVASYLGGNASYKDGEWTAPKFTVQAVDKEGKVSDATYHDVTTAFAGVGTSFTNVNNNLTNKFNELTEKITNIKQEVQGDALLWDKTKSAFVAMHGEKEGEKSNSKITALQNGEINEKSTDAVAGQQLHQLGSEVAKYFGGDAKYENGKLIAPSFKVKTVKDDGSDVEEQSYGSVAAAFEGIGTSFKNLRKEVKSEIDKVVGDSLVKQDEKTNLITIGKEVEGSEINIANSKNGLRTISGVKEATQDNQAVNKGQLDKSLEKLSNSLQSEDSAVVHYDKKADDNNSINYASVTLGGKDKDKTPVGLHNVANGVVSSSSHDAINGSQLHTLGTEVAKYFGGSAGFKDGAFTGPTYQLSQVSQDGTVETTDFKNVGSAFEGLDKNIKNVNNRIKEVSQGVAQDSLNWSKTANAFVATHGEDKQNSKITSLKNGDISASSTDAVAGQQLHQLGSEVAKFLGGNANYDGGKWTAPKFTVKSFKEGGTTEDKDYSDVTSAFAGVGSSFTNVDNRITNVKNEITKEISQVVSDSLVKQDETTKVIKIGKEVEGSEINIANKSGEARALSGVKEATQDNQAVNKGQLDKSLEKLSNSLQSEDSAVVHYDKKADDNNSIDYASVTLGGKDKDKTPVGLHNVANGVVSSSSHDAINGSQLHTLGTEVAKYFGGGATFSEGSLKEPTYQLSKVSQDGTVETTDFKNVGSAFEGLDKNIQNVNDRIKDVSESVTQDSLNWNKEAGAFVATHGKDGEKTNSKIKFLANGDISASSTEAVNGSQLYSLNTTLAQYFGGDAAFKDGIFTGPTYKLSKVSQDGKVEKAEFKDVGLAFSGLDENIKNVNDRIKDVSESVAQDSLNWNKEAGAFVATHGKDGAKTNSKITSLQNGDISASSTDAVAGQQLHALGNDVAAYFGGNASYKNGTWIAPKFTLKTVKEDGSAVEEQSYGSVAAAFEGIGTSFKNLHKEVTQGNTEVSENIKQNALLWSDEDKAFVATHGKDGEKTNSKITSLQNGDISASSTDAVAGQQLHALGNEVAAYFGGDASYENGSWKAPSFKVNIVKEDGSAVEEQSYGSVAEAFAGVGSSFTNIHNEVKNKISQVVKDSLVKQDEKTKVIKIGGEQDGTTITIADKDNKDRILSGVKAAANDNEAVNKGQLDKGLKDLSNSLQSEESAVVLYDKGSDGNTNYGSVTFGKGKDSSPVGLHNVANGQLSEGSHDVVTGGQINTISQDVAKFLGGDAGFKNGAFTGPTYQLSKVSKDGHVEKHAFKDVGSAFSGLDENIKNVNDRIKDVSESVAQDSLNWNKDEGAFVATHGEKGGKKTNSKIKFLANGDIAEGSTEAVNGSQLYSMSNTLATYLGGGAGYANGEWHKPDFKVNVVKEDGSAVEEKSYKTVAEAFAGVGSSFTNIHKELKTEIKKVVGDSLVKQNEETHVISIGGEKSGTEVKLANVDGASRTLSGVKSGALSEESTQAVNGSQLFATNQHVSTVSTNLETAATDIAKSFGGGAKYEGGVWTAPKFTVKSFEEEGKVSDETYHDVASAFAGVGSSFSNVNNRITNVKDEITKEINQVVSDSLVKQDETTKVIKIGAEKEGTAITIANSNGDARSLSGVKAAILSESSTEAVNGGQLYSLNKTLATYFGGDAQFADGKWTPPSFKVLTFNDDGSSKEESYPDITAAFAGVSSSFKKLHKELSDNSDKVEQNALLWSDEENAFVALHGQGSDRSKSKLKSLLDGDISEGSTEAITGNQLYALNTTLATYFGGGAKYENGSWTAPTFNVAQFNSDGSSSTKESHDVAGAFNTVSESMTNINNRIKDVSDNIDKNSLHWNEEQGAYDASHNGEASHITNIANGEIKAGSQDAVNGGQLWETNERVTKVENRVDTLDKHVQDIETAVTDGAVNYDKGADGKKTNSITLVGGNESDPVLIDNVADGKIETGSKQAVNGGQLHDYTKDQMKIVLDDAKKYTDDQVGSLVNKGVNEAKSYTDMKFETLSYAVEDVRKEARQAAAIGLAVSNLRYYDIPGSLSVSFGTGLWRSQSAFAIGAGYTSEDGNIRSNLSVTSAGGHFGIGAGITLRLR
ncbi:Vomp family autotransporter [Bartonella machadoae]|nr:Vomp family autotransporter [Bartonella machadoae]UNE54516.1 Vomp family autotransporter [Bartonella machadoae]